MKVVTITIDQQVTHIHGVGGICLLEESWIKTRRAKEPVRQSSTITKTKLK